MNLQAILDQHGIPYRLHGQHHHVTRGWIGIDCPFCSSGTGKYRLGINLAQKRITCWTCGPHRLGDTLIELTGEPLGTVLGWLDGLRGPRSSRVPAGKPRGRLQTPLGVEALRRPHRAYLEGRGFDPDTIARLWGVKGIGISARLSWRLWIPIIDRGKIVSWTTRSIGNSGKRYISASPEEEEKHHKSLLYGEDYVRHAVIIHEGPTDVWRTGPGAVALLGLGHTMAQLLRLSVYPVRVVCFDNEVEAQKRARRLAAELQVYPGETVVVEMETGADVAEADKAEVQKLRKEYLE